MLSLTIFHSARAQIAVGFGSADDPLVGVFSLSPNSGFRQIFVVPLRPKVIPKSLHIDEVSKDVLVFAMEGGHVYAAFNFLDTIFLSDFSQRKARL